MSYVCWLIFSFVVVCLMLCYVIVVLLVLSGCVYEIFGVIYLMCLVSFKVWKNGEDRVVGCMVEYILCWNLERVDFVVCIFLLIVFVVLSMCML